MGLAVAGAAAAGRRAALVCWRDAFCFSRICEELSADTGEAADGLSATGCWKPRWRERGEALLSASLLHGSIQGPCRSHLSRRREAGTIKAVPRPYAAHHRHAGILRGT